MLGNKNTDYFSSTSLRIFTAFAFCCLLALQTGCMVTPNTSERVSDRDDGVLVMMATLSPEDVEIEALNKFTGLWQNIGIVTTNFDSIEFAGRNWIVGSNEIHIPDECWKVRLAGHSLDRIYYEAEIRAITESGAEALTFQRGFYDWVLNGLDTIASGDLRLERDASEAASRVNGPTLKIRTDIITP